MSIFEKSRFKIFNATQHPLKHEISDLSYSNPRLPGVSLLGDALDAVVASIYPNYKSTVPSKAQLPASASLNDYYIVNDDGDGNAAGYVWSVIDNTGQWIKRYDMDWSMDAILAEAVNRTQPMYVAKYGADDRDATGTTVTGTFAGQRVYGGESANTNLTLSANSGDAPGAHTGFVQVDDPLRPTEDKVYDLGTLTKAWKDVFAESLKIGTMTISEGSITDTSGEVSFGSANITTTGVISALNLNASGSVSLGNFSFSGSELTTTTGSILLDDNHISTTGNVESGGILVDSDLSIDGGSITSASGSISFGDENLSTTGTLSVGSVSGSSISTGNISISGNTISVTNTNGGINLQTNGAGEVFTAANFTGRQITATDSIWTNGAIYGNAIAINGNNIQATSGSSISVIPASGGFLAVSGSIVANSASKNLGWNVTPWENLYLNGLITKTGAISITTDTLLTLRDITVGAATGDSLFWDGSKWVASNPDTEVVHSEVSGLTTGDAGHSQFVMLAGRAGGQVVQGGTAAFQNLTLESTSNATKGSVYTADSLKPLTNASYSGTWAGTDLGDNTHYFRDVYLKGEARGLRVENGVSNALPSASASARGRLVYATDNQQIYVDVGGSWVSLSSLASGGGRFAEDIAFNGSELTKDVDVSADITDARNALWQLKDNENSFEVMFVKITATSATNVRIQTNVALPAASYRLIGIE